MDILTKLKGLSGLGMRTLLQSFGYALRRDAAERGTVRPSGTPRPIGRLSATEPRPHGLKARVGDATCEVEFLAADLVRVTWQPGTLPVPYALADREWPGADVRHAGDAGAPMLATEGMSVEIASDGTLSFLDASGALLRRDLPPLRDGERWLHRAQGRADERWFGLGERTSPLNLRGGSFRLWNLEAKGSYLPGQDPLYLGVPLYMGIHGAGSYLVFFENTFDGTARFRGDPEVEFEGGALRYYFIPGPPARALRRLGELTGTSPLPPRWSLGFHQARWSYMDEAEVRAVVEGFRRHRVPLSALHLDIHYMDGYRVFTVDPHRFPDLKRLCSDLEREGTKIVVIQDPGVKVDAGWDLYRDGLEKKAYCALPDGRPAVAPVWPGDAVFPDFTDPAARRWWSGFYPRLLDAGVAGVWHDMNEPAAFAAWGEPTLPRTVRHSLEGRGGDHREAHNVYALQELRAAHEALRSHRPDRRPWLLSRSGWVGLQRYSWSWTGDGESNWWSLHQTVRMALSLGLCGMPYTGADIGGFGGEPDAELFTRWFQLGAFLPFFRVHSAWFTERREPWCFGDATLSVVREHVRQRLRLMPYLYTLAEEMQRTGHPWVRPLWWPDASDAALLDVDDAFLVGDALLVAPVLEAGARTRTIRVPAGRWYSLADDRVFDGPGEVRIDAPPERIPVLVRAGTVLPTDEDGHLALHVYAATGDGGGRLYSDAGDGYGESRVDTFRFVRQEESLVLERSHEGKFPFPFGRVSIALHGTTGDRVQVDGRVVPVIDGRAETGVFERIVIG